MAVNPSSSTAADLVQRLEKEAKFQEDIIRSNRGWTPSGMDPKLLREAASALASRVASSPPAVELRPIEQWACGCLFDSLGKRHPCVQHTSRVSETPPPSSEQEQPLCAACDGVGWCEGSPAFTCPECKGLGIHRDPPSPTTQDEQNKGA